MSLGGLPLCPIPCHCDQPKKNRDRLRVFMGVLDCRLGVSPNSLCRSVARSLLDRGEHEGLSVPIAV